MICSEMSSMGPFPEMSMRVCSSYITSLPQVPDGLLNRDNISSTAECWHNFNNVFMINSFFMIYLYYSNIDSYNVNYKITIICLVE